MSLTTKDPVRSISASRVVHQNTYHLALAAGYGPEEAKQRANLAVARVHAEDAITDPVGATLRQQNRDTIRFRRENHRLRAERDALLTALAQALGTTENTAWRIARLDLEGPEDTA